MPPQSDRNTMDHLCTARNADTGDGLKRRSNSSLPIRIIERARSARRGLCSRSGLSDQGSTLEDSARWPVPIEGADRMGMNSFRLPLGRSGSISKAMSWSFSRITSMLFEGVRLILRVAKNETVDGSLNIATSWSRSWAGRCTSGNPFTIETETGNTTTRPISNYGSRHNRPAFGWRMWLKSMGRNWWPLDSAFVNSKHNFQTALSSLHASLGVGLSGLTCREV